MKYKLFAIIVLGLTISCSTTKTSVIVADSYDKSTNITTLSLLPYGSIEIPGQWTKTRYNEVSRQHFFVDKDSTSIAITKNPQEKYPFYHDSISDKEFAMKFFEWEKDFYEKHGYEIQESSKSNNFVIWTASGNNANTIFLYGAKNKYAYNFSVFSDNWAEEERVNFLKNIFEIN
ncbi:hypothetical protein [Persicobacter psychrovividus]|uniref:PsbP C-terminal domain-containing protein n=1 Tax=Persicobacter psychrovividus TaxID=387638 RepID=A0ABM7VEU2_9BACT|nr:hypothetical protein PEPS_17560 [Persicobacter psychrovividus]